MELTEKLRKALSSQTWYHATTKENFDNILKNGIIANYNIGRELDFGYGFYLTTTDKLAENYLRRLYGSFETLEYEKLVIMEYCFNPLEWFENAEYNATVFEKFDDSFAEFVFKNRLESKTNQQRHNYDVIYGVMSDSLPTQLLLKYRAQEMKKEDVLEGLKKSNSMKQLSIHNQALCDIIKLNRAYEFDVKTLEKKELDIL